MMNITTSRYSTICSSKKSGDILFEADLNAASEEEAETRGFVTCVRAGNNYDEIRVEAKKAGTSSAIH
jgi:hypothetical protein